MQAHLFRKGGHGIHHERTGSEETDSNDREKYGASPRRFSALELGSDTTRKHEEQHPGRQVKGRERGSGGGDGRLRRLHGEEPVEEDALLPGRDAGAGGVGEVEAAHCAVRIAADDDQGRERLVRSCARPPFARRQLHLPADDNYIAPS
jgi:hypothetical protein